MSHEVTIIDGVAKAAYAFRPAWHDLGKVFPELLTTSEALDTSGIDFDVEKRVLFIQENGAFVPVDGFRAIYGSDGYGVVGIHTDEYEPDKFGDHVRALGFAPDARVWECMVNLRKGRMFTGTVRLPDLDMILPDGSHYTSCVVVYSSHDGTYSITYKDSSYRAECANMLRAVDNSRDGRVVRIKHTANKNATRANAAGIMTYAQERADYHSRQAERLLAYRMPKREVALVLDGIWPLVDAKGQKLEGRGLTIATNNRDEVTAIHNNVPDQQDIKGTAWGWVQAFGNFADHNATYRSRGATSDDERVLQRAENKVIRTVLKGNTVADEALSLIDSLVPVTV